MQSFVTSCFSWSWNSFAQNFVSQIKLTSATSDNKKVFLKKELNFFGWNEERLIFKFSQVNFFFLWDNWRNLVEAIEHCAEGKRGAEKPFLNSLKKTINKMQIKTKNEYTWINGCFSKTKSRVEHFYLGWLINETKLNVSNFIQWLVWE